MKKVILAIIISVFLTTAFAWAEDYDHLIDKIDRVWVERTDNSAPMKDSLKLAEQAYGIKPGFDAAWRAARACFWICDRSENEKVDLEYGKRGYEWGQKAITANPGAVEGHYYYTICLGEYGKGLSIVTALAKGLGGKYEVEGDKAISINGAYEHGGPYRAMGRYFYTLPWPKYNFKKSEKYYLDGIKAAPEAARAYFYLAELYVKEKDYEKAKQALAKLNDVKDLADGSWEQKYYKRLGKDLLEEINQKK